MMGLSQPQVRSFKGVRITMPGSSQVRLGDSSVAEPAFKGAPSTSEMLEKGRGLCEPGTADKLKIC